MSKTNCVNIAVNEENCACTSVDCERHGVCCECVRAHAAAEGLPKCLKVKVQDSEAFREYLTKLLDQAI